MKEYPILFSEDVVRAILDGRKTQTRRVVKPFIHDLSKMTMAQMMKHKPTGQQQAFFSDGKSKDWFGTSCPYGQPGDRLWVRETWRPCKCGRMDCPGFIYRADGEPAYLPGMWRPSIHMPRLASRILLEVTDVCVERVQDISEDDAKAEGAQIGPDGFPIASPPLDDGYECCRDWFADLWDSIYAKRGLGWDANPWVWVVEFVRI